MHRVSGGTLWGKDLLGSFRGLGDGRSETLRVSPVSEWTPVTRRDLGGNVVARVSEWGGTADLDDQVGPPRRVPVRQGRTVLGGRCRASGPSTLSRLTLRNSRLVRSVRRGPTPLLPRPPPALVADLNVPEDGRGRLLTPGPDLGTRSGCPSPVVVDRALSRQDPREDGTPDGRVSDEGSETFCVG